MTITLPQTVRSELSFTDIATVNIRAICARFNFSASDLARALKMNRTALGCRWRGVTDWRLEEIGQIAALFGTTPWELLTPAFGDTWVPNKEKLPRLDSNQQPAD